jgi:hypothetical protein
LHPRERETSLGFIARPLAGVPAQSDAVLGLADAINEPDELRESVRALAARPGSRVA